MTFNVLPPQPRNPIAVKTIEITRPANTTAYTVNSVVDATVAAGFLFPDLVPYNGGNGKLVKWRLSTTQKTNVAVFRMHLYAIAPSFIADGLKYPYLYAEVANYQGSILFPAMATADPTSSTAAFAEEATKEMEFACAAGARSLIGLLETLTAFTPDSQQKFSCRIVAQGL